MSTLMLPALRGDDPLGFLATLGVIEVLRSEVGVPEGELMLRWEDMGPASIEAPLRDLDDLVGALVEAARRMRSEGRLVTGRVADLVPRTLSDKERKEVEARTGVKLPFDPIRMSRVESVARVSTLGRVGVASDARWLCALVDQCSTFPGEQTAHVTPLYAPVGRQRMRQVYASKLEAVCANPELLREACEAWRRNPSDAGVNLDRRAVRDSAVTTNGEPGNAAVTGAEWLALQSVPWFRLGGVRDRPTAWGWVAAGSRGRPRALVWPLWRPPLDPVAVEVLLTHRVVRRAGLGGPVNDQEARNLGLVAVLRADRAVLTNSDGPLGPGRVLWPSG